VSDKYYQDTIDTPLHGSGQGSGSASTLWLFISSIIMTIYQDLAAGMQMTNSDITENLQQWIDGYVDDTSIFTSINEQEQVPTAQTIALQLVQQDACIWEQLLAATGGKLELTKCFYYILLWKFDEEGVPSHTSKQELEEAGVTIAIQEKGKDQPTEINHNDCNTAHQTLGVYKTITGNQSEQKKQISEKSETISRAVGAANFTRNQTKTAWNTMYIPGVTYPSVATYLEERELVKIENKAIMAGVSTKDGVQPYHSKSSSIWTRRTRWHRNKKFICRTVHSSNNSNDPAHKIIFTTGSNNPHQSGLGSNYCGNPKTGPGRHSTNKTYGG
jgi:hypothetical protein